MQSRLSYLIVLASVAVLGSVGYFFYREFRATDERSSLLTELATYETRDQPCDGLTRARQLWPSLDAQTQPGVKQWRRAFTKRIVGEGDPETLRTVLEAEEAGLVDRALCEQIRLAHDLGEEHPVVTFLRLTREGADPCADGGRLVDTLQALGSHRPAMLHSLMRNVGRLQCLEPTVASALAGRVLGTTSEAPQLFDDLDVARIAAFTDAWAPVLAAQTACHAELRGIQSKLFATIGCTPDQRRRLLPIYDVGPAATPGAPGASQRGRVWLLAQDADLCDVQPITGRTEIVTVDCARLQLRSDVQVATRIETLAYGPVRADVIAGVASYDGASTNLDGTPKEPTLGSWFAYSRDGRLLGTTRQVRLADLAKQLGEKLPEAPLRTACRRAGARYCYDVDWAQVVQSLGDEAMVFLSRPLPVFLAPLEESDETNSLADESLGRARTPGAVVSTYALGDSGRLLIEQQNDAVELRWRTTSKGPWQAQSLGRGEGGTPTPAARVVSVMDIDRDGMPELLIERETFRLRGSDKQPENDIVWLARLESTARRFVPMSKLLVREY